MATLALPITELLPMVKEAERETRQVVVCSRASQPTVKLLFQIMYKTVHLKNRLSHVARQQDSLISTLTSRDFSKAKTEDLTNLVASIDNLVGHERELLGQAQKLGAGLRFWWNSSLRKLSEQTEHLDSISESLHAECSMESSVLLGLAVQQFAIK